jgi:hypothetical protein
LILLAYLNKSIVLITFDLLNFLNKSNAMFKNKIIIDSATSKSQKIKDSKANLYGKDRQEIKNLFDDGKTIDEIAAITGKHRANVARTLKTYFNVDTLPKRGDALKTSRDNAFDNMEDKDVQYWFGLIAADGCITNGNKLQFDTIDYEHADKFVRWIGFQFNMPNINEQRKSKYKWYRVSVRNDRIVEKLKQYGISERKSLTLDINVDITYDILRGYFDGNGSVVEINKQNRGGLDISICTASRTFAIKIVKFLKSETYSINRYIREAEGKHPLYDIRINQAESVIKFYKNLYYTGCTYLNRKKAKYEELMQKSTSNKYNVPAQDENLDDNTP